MVNLQGKNWNILQSSLEQIAKQLDEFGIDNEGADKIIAGDVGLETSVLIKSLHL